MQIKTKNAENKKEGMLNSPREKGGGEEIEENNRKINKFTVILCWLLFLI